MRVPQLDRSISSSKNKREAVQQRAAIPAEPTTPPPPPLPVWRPFSPCVGGSRRQQRRRSSSTSALPLAADAQAFHSLVACSSLSAQKCLCRKAAAYAALRATIDGRAARMALNHHCCGGRTLYASDAAVAWTTERTVKNPRAPTDAPPRGRLVRKTLPRQSHRNSPPRPPSRRFKDIYLAFSRRACADWPKMKRRSNPPVPWLQCQKGK